MTISANINSGVDLGLPITPEIVDDPKVYSELVLLYRAVKAVQSTAFVTPAGTIIDFAGTAAPAGFLVCPTVATNKSRTEFAALFAAIGTTWGAGDGSTTFGIPWFPANYTAVAASGNVGTTTAGENLTHTHGDAGHGHTVIAYGNTLSLNPGGGGFRLQYYRDGDGSLGFYTGTGYANIQAAGGAANLAAAVRLLKCVKI